MFQTQHTKLQPEYFKWSWSLIHVKDGCRHRFSSVIILDLVQIWLVWPWNRRYTDYSTTRWHYRFRLNKQILHQLQFCFWFIFLHFWAYKCLFFCFFFIFSQNHHLCRAKFNSWVFFYQDKTVVAEFSCTKSKTVWAFGSLWWWMLALTLKS